MSLILGGPVGSILAGGADDHGRGGDLDLPVPIMMCNTAPQGETWPVFVTCSERERICREFLKSACINIPKK